MITGSWDFKWKALRDYLGWYSHFTGKETKAIEVKWLAKSHRCRKKWDSFWFRESVNQHYGSQWGANPCEPLGLLGRGLSWASIFIPTTIFILFRSSTPCNPGKTPRMQNSLCRRSSREWNRADHLGSIWTMWGNHCHPKKQEKFLPHSLCWRVHGGQSPLPLW